MQDRSEPLKDAVVGFGGVFREEGADLAHETDGDFYGVVGGLGEHEDEHFEGDDFVGDGLVDEVGDEGTGGLADDLELASNYPQHNIAYEPSDLLDT